MTVIDTPSGIDRYTAAVVAQGLEFYAKHGRPLNRAYTPKNLMAMAVRITGRDFKKRDYIGAAHAIRSAIGSPRRAP